MLNVICAATLSILTTIILFNVMQVLPIAVMAGFLSPTQTNLRHATYARLPKDRPHAKTLINSGLPPRVNGRASAQENALMKSEAKKHGLCLFFLENKYCEGHRTTLPCDLFFSQQMLFRIRPVVALDWTGPLVLEFRSIHDDNWTMLTGICLEGAHVKIYN